jgi:hypothetical protein
MLISAGFAVPAIVKFTFCKYATPPDATLSAFAPALAEYKTELLIDTNPAVTVTIRELLILYIPTVALALLIVTAPKKQLVLNIFEPEPVTLVVTVPLPWKSQS